MLEVVDEELVSALWSEALPEDWTMVLWDDAMARDWDVSLVSSRRAYTHHWKNRKEVNAEGWVNPGYAASWCEGELTVT